jgi:signal transduction histidine kinase
MEWKHVSLRSRILLIVGALVVAAVVGGLVTMRYIYWLGSTLTAMMDRDVASLRTAQELETALVLQKGYVAYYLDDGDPSWLRRLDEHRNAFEEWLRKAREYPDSEQGREILARIESEYLQYDASRQNAIRLFQADDRVGAARARQGYLGAFFRITDLSEQYKRLHQRSMEEARRDIEARAQFINDLALATLPAVLLLGILLGHILIRQVLEPIRRLAMEAEEARGRGPVKDEVKALSRRVHNLVEDRDLTKSQLERSQEHLIQSEKWAMMGKLAAGVAHSIRNPLTSVKMRLFSLQRALDLSSAPQEDFEVISEEVRHIDSIVRNFLEYSRPEKLNMKKASPSDVVDMALLLLRHRLESYGVTVAVERPGRLPAIWADPEQFKEVLVNLLVNACEAMSGGGAVVISEAVGLDDALGRVVRVTVQDNGPGIPASIRDKVFQPFFSTKEEGTGLGLSIAARIVEEHGGWLRLRSGEGEGAAFVITLPLREEEVWERS